MGVTANDHLGAQGLGSATHICSKPWPANGDVRQQHHEARLTSRQRELDDIWRRQISTVDVATYRDQRRDGLKLLEHRELADVSTMQDERWRLGAQQIYHLWVGHRVRVSDDRNPTALWGQREVSPSNRQGSRGPELAPPL